MSDAAANTVYQLKVSLRAISPMIWRRLLVPADLTLYGLHRVIQIAFGWEDYHLHAFKLHGRRYGTMWTGERHHHADGREVALADLGVIRDGTVRPGASRQVDARRAGAFEVLTPGRPASERPRPINLTSQNGPEIIVSS